MAANRPPLSAAILAGGMSSRMGRDKALLRIRPTDLPLIAEVLERVRAVADDTFIVASDRPAYAAFGVDVVADEIPGTGTLGGIISALGRAKHAHCLVVACDMPFLDPALLAWMADQPRDYDALVPRVAGESRQGGKFVFQTLHAIYGQACAEPIRRRLAADDRRVIGFFPEVRVRPVEETTLRQFDPALRSFFNANTPEAAAEAARLRDATDALS